MTGKDISDQRKGSKFISAKKIGYSEAHRLRNMDSNPRNNLRRKIEKLKRENSFFELKDCLKLTQDQKKMLEFWNGTNNEIIESFNKGLARE